MKKRLNFPLLVFDWDGTLMDSEAHIVGCIRASIADLGLPTLDNTAIRNIIGLGLREAINRLFPGSDDSLHEQLAARYRQHFLADDRTPSELFPGVKETLIALHGQGYFLAVATGKGRHGLNSVLHETGCKELFHASRCADECASKPHPQMLLEIMDELNVPPSNTLMIGDTEYDMHMARNAGVAAVAVSCGVHEEQRLLQCEPLLCLTSIAELPMWLHEQSAAQQTLGQF